jgi:hypothetical protein
VCFTFSQRKYHKSIINKAEKTFGEMPDVFLSPNILKVGTAMEIVQKLRMVKSIN